MSRPYERKTDRRSREERRYSVRAEHRQQPDVDLLAELLIRFALQDAGEARRRFHRAPEWCPGRDQASDVEWSSPLWKWMLWFLNPRALALGKITWAVPA